VLRSLSANPLVRLKNRIYFSFDGRPPEKIGAAKILNITAEVLESTIWQVLDYIGRQDSSEATSTLETAATCEYILAAFEKDWSMHGGLSRL